ncbi:zinc ribbon domain-containing protein [Candidatus Bathyarchaeota archaeon]|nr:zinc ribbon domain-containing protein [Candidatus Bathyarchaeota archaeon]
MVRKGVAVWVFSTLSFIAAIHALEAALWLFFDRAPVLLKNYPIINELNVNPLLYFSSSAFITFIFWGITCIIALENPIERFLNHILSDAKKQTELESEFIEENKTILDMISETLTENNRLLAQIRDLTYNVRAEISVVKPLTEGIEKINSEIEKLRKEVKKIKVEIKKPNVCPTCGKEVLPDFNICPYCGENLKLIPQKIIKAYK